MPDLLLELFCEEIPARMQRKAAGDLSRLVADGLKQAGLKFEGAAQYWTPRRLTLHLTGLEAQSADIREERKGPRTDAPEQAIAGFLRGAGLESADQAEVRNDPKKGDFYVAVIEKKGRAANEVIAELVPSIIRSFPWPKSQRWGSGTLKWVRPLRSILCTFDGQIVDFDVDGIAASDKTFGHRFHAPDEISASNFADYAAALEKASVVLGAEDRKAKILAAAQALASDKGLELVEDAGLLEEVSGLVEMPVVLMGEFEESFLDIPDEAIRLTIKENQKCFVLKKGENLSNHFILVSNIEASDGGAEIVRGNQKVVNARLSDAKFFWETDLALKLDDLLPKLDNVTFHAKLGTQGARVQRIVELAEFLASFTGSDLEKAKRAALLCKADLNTNMVYEFPELQGMMGRLYAGKAGEDASVALAMEEHYKPQGPSDDVPTDLISVTVALADKLDLLTGFWAINEKPTGSKDPYALRRAALGVIRLVVENNLRLPLSTVIFDNWLDHSAHLSDDTQNTSFEFSFGEQLGSFKIDLERSGGKLSNRKSLIDSFTSYIKGDENEKAADVPIISDLLSFFHDRLTVWLKDQGARDDVVKAVLATDGANDDLLMVKQRVDALGAFLLDSDAENLTQGLKRGANILAAEEKKGVTFALNVNASLLQQDEEKALSGAIEAASVKVAELTESENFGDALEALANLREPVDAFFEAVMVNADDENVRANRLALLAKLRGLAAQIADFGLLQN